MRLIDADALKEKSYCTEFAIPVVDVEDIDNAPTIETSIEHFVDLEQIKKGADLIRPHGEWIYKEYDFICSNCNGHALELNDYPYLSTYCPNCGAKMEVKNEDNKL